jgi:hypothetical protein
MARKQITGPCKDCGRTVTKLELSKPRLVCEDCGTERARRAAYEMATKSGPAWDRFLLSRGPEGARSHRTVRK